MYLSELDWDDVPEDVSVLVGEYPKEINFVKGLQESPDSRYKWKGKEILPDFVTEYIDVEWADSWKLLERPAKQAVKIEQPLSPEEYNFKVIGDWLHKYATVYMGCYEVGGIDFAVDKTPVICTDMGDIKGTKEVVDFINMRYNQLKQAESNKRKQELEDKRLKVLAELSEIDQELGRY